MAIVCVGFDNGNEGEGSDRSFGLPDGQDDLVSGVADINPKTVVVIDSGGNVDMRRWLNKVPALLHAWYPGQEGGNALAKVLFGDVDPSGKLPVTFEANQNDNPPFESYPSDDGGESVHYDEGIFVGYRGYDHLGIEPIFPFGFGLSYTRFEYSNLRFNRKTELILLRSKSRSRFAIRGNEREQRSRNIMSVPPGQQLNGPLES